MGLFALWHARISHFDGGVYDGVHHLGATDDCAWVDGAGINLEIVDAIGVIVRI